MENREKEEELRRWSDMVASATINYNILTARRGQELVEIKYLLRDVKPLVEGLPNDEKQKALDLLNSCLGKIGSIVKDQYVHYHNGPEVALQLRNESSDYLSEAEQRQLKKFAFQLKHFDFLQTLEM